MITESAHVAEPPEGFSAISEAIQRAKELVDRPRDESDDLGLKCSQEAWQRAVNILKTHAELIWKHTHILIKPPIISAGPDGSVDLYWAAAPYGLLINVPADANEPATYYGDDATNPDSNRVSGKLNPTRAIDPGVLIWLAHTSEQ
jgi:hypothetical protein